MTSQLSAKACICVAHHMHRVQNPKAFFRTDADHAKYIALVSAWCSKQEIDGVRYYFHAQPDDLLPRRILQ